MAALGAHTSLADTPRYLGQELDKQHRFVVRQDANLLSIELLTRARPEQDDFVRHNGEEEVYRQGRRETLARVRSDVLMPAAPNYMNNPGRRYRIVVEGVDVGHGFASVAEVDASDARLHLYEELTKLRELAHGPKKTALYYASLIALAALSEAGYLPAHIPLSQLESPMAEARLDPTALERKPLDPDEEGFSVHQSVAGGYEASKLTPRRPGTRGRAGAGAGNRKRAGAGRAGRAFQPEAPGSHVISRDQPGARREAVAIGQWYRVKEPATVSQAGPQPGLAAGRPGQAGSMPLRGSGQDLQDRAVGSGLGLGVPSQAIPDQVLDRHLNE